MIDLLDGCLIGKQRKFTYRVLDTDKVQHVVVFGENFD
jgi:hypothetical protein